MSRIKGSGMLMLSTYAASYPVPKIKYSKDNKISYKADGTPKRRTGNR